jgi:CheY-like chemotaxis protein
MTMTTPNQNKRVLIVERHPFTTQILARLLARRGFRAALAADGADALEWLAEEPFGAVVSDVFIPGLTGLELVAKIQQRFPRVPVVLLTAFLADELRPTALAAGAAALLKKPVNGNELAGILNGAAAPVAALAAA